MNKRIKIVLIALIIFTYCDLYAQDKDPGERLSSSETTHNLQKNKIMVSPSVDQLINIDKSGDVSITIPLVNVSGRKLQIPIQLNYNAGIKVYQKSSEVGLGWSINFGSIVRDYGAFEPDYAETTAESKMVKKNPAGFGSYGSQSENLEPFDNGGSGYSIFYSGILNATTTNGDEDRMTPDDYHINIPGVGSNTFWNKGLEGANVGGVPTPDFIFNEYQPWKINYKIKNYIFDQEYSRINELTFAKLLSGNLYGDKNIAAAIAIPPYVNNRDFGGDVSINLIGPNFSNVLSTKVKYDDFANFTVVTEDGTQYIFGRALRGQKYLFTEDPFWSTHPISVNTASNASHGQFWKIDFIAEWLLTEIRSVDYVDSNNNEQLDDEDEGDWIKIEYSAPTKFEEIPGSKVSGIEVPTHREWMNFTQTDKYSSLMRERAYVTKITTPVQEIEFSSSKKMDVDHDYFKTPLNDPDGDNNYYYSNHGIPEDGNNVTILNVDYPIELMKYDKIVVKEKVQDNVLYPRNRTTNTIVLNYADKGSAEELAVSKYLIRDNNNIESVTYYPEWNGPWITGSGNVGFEIEDYLVTTSGYNAGVGRGKTTLLGIDFFPEDGNNSPDKKSYHFEYGNNPSFSEIHKFEISKANGFPSLRESKISNTSRGLPKTVKTSLAQYLSLQYRSNLGNGNIETYMNLASNEIGIDEMGYYLNPTSSSNALKDRDAWSLSKVTLPTGGSIELEYELDEFDYNGDRIEWYGDGVLGSLVDDGLPYISHYNKLANSRSVVQDRVNAACGVDKKLYRSFHYPMNQFSGGLRLKKKILNDGINPIMEVAYQYGTGHYTSVPASYWQNYISTFSSFMLAESVMQ